MLCGVRPNAILSFQITENTAILFPTFSVLLLTFCGLQPIVISCIFYFPNLVNFLSYFLSFQYNYTWSKHVYNSSLLSAKLDESRVGYLEIQCQVYKSGHVLIISSWFNKVLRKSNIHSAVIRI